MPEESAANGFNEFSIVIMADKYIPETETLSFIEHCFSELQSITFL